MQGIMELPFRTLEIADLPTHLRDAVREFVPIAQNEEYDVNEDGLCFEATSEFVRHLHRTGIESDKPFEKLSFKFCLSEHDPVEWKLSERARRHRKLLPYDDNGANFHYVVKVWGYVIDWTSRQFDPRLPFPTIWKEEEWPLR